MLNEIEKMLAKRFSDKHGLIYYPTDANDVDILEAVVQMFIDREFPVEDFCVEYKMVYESTGQDIAVLSVAFIDWGKLYHETFTVISC